MKKLLLLTALFFGFTLSSVNAGNRHYKHININYFYSELEPYGEWIEIGYDEYVWRPYRVDRYWKPYSEGRWEWTRHGWYWVSYEPFGWATYHYGRWFYDDYYGWVWMPDNVWAPAWVEWRYNDYYIGWAPLPPYASFRPRTGIYFSISWHSNHHYWNFVNYNHFVSINVHNYYVDNSVTKRIFRNTKYRTNYFTDNNRIVNAGVGRKFIEKRIGKKLTTRRISRTDRFSEYKTKDIKRSKEIVEYRPTNKEFKKRSTFNTKKITKGRTLKSLKSDKVIINRSSSKNKNLKFKGIKKDTKSLSKENRNYKTKRSNDKSIKKGNSSKTDVKLKTQLKKKGFYSENRVKKKNNIRKHNIKKNSNINRKINKNKTNDVVKKYNRSVKTKKSNRAIKERSTKVLSKKKVTARSRNNNSNRF